jgi:Chromo (CHRromatin Organisation MOdifier) domain
MKIHPVFHVSLLDPYKSSTIPDRTQDPLPPVVVDDELEWEVEEILDSKFRRRQLFYKVRWINYPPSDDSWQPASDVANSQDLVDEFHSRYPNKLRSLSRARSAS